MFVADAREEGALADRLIDAWGVTSMFCVPLSSSGRCLGFLLGDRRGARFELDAGALAALDVVGVVTATLLEKLLVAEEMQRLDSMKSEFIAIASHELRTPLTSVYGISLTLDERGDALSAGERAPAAPHAQGAVGAAAYARRPTTRPLPVRRRRS